jgi:mannose-1-phosphate guanylyltransferase
MQVTTLDGYLVTFGIQPTYPETGYGYIEGNNFDVKSFKEKPSKEVAQEYLNAGNYYWNSGMFIWKTKTILDNIKRYMKEHGDIISNLELVISNERLEEEEKILRASLV